MRQSVWFSIGEGPIIDATAVLRQGLSQSKSDKQIGPWRIGEQRRDRRQREIEIIFDDDDSAVFAQMKFG